MKTITAKELINSKINEYLESSPTEERDKYFELTNLIRNTKELIDATEVEA